MTATLAVSVAVAVHLAAVVAAFITDDRFVLAAAADVSFFVVAPAF